MLQALVEILHSVADVFTVVASGIAIYLYFANRNELAQAFRLLLNFSYQTTLAELKEKLERLNEYNANEPTEVPEIRNILHEIAGQIKGNSRLQEAVVSDLVSRIETAATSRKLLETTKRSLVAEIREVLRNLNVKTLIGN